VIITISGLLIEEEEEEEEEDGGYEKNRAAPPDRANAAAVATTTTSARTHARTPRNRARREDLGAMPEPLAPRGLRSSWKRRDVAFEVTARLLFYLLPRKFF
jgi:hypothetical protein